ncbi:MAG: hypothetical protein Q4P07_04355 [Ornithinimicrobium sp.]|uniref:hypothetical protein n=1 Tax=Ornithinimicrobium sp. TaxID=1977084 RepID=UPI0026DF7192|nr:hypothetical protein [Ornithinimicrobium sp.]MDO5739363.1 hypothetical protein [Ornithinimicrobium sp.]
MAQIGVVTWLAAGYGVVLLFVAYGIDTMARRAARKVEDQSAGGFVYHEEHDAWVCPEDQWLWPQSFDPDNRVMRYRGSPSVCNSCPVKSTCTTSSSGREVRRLVDSWPSSESARFHRAIACCITVLAVAWPGAAALTRSSTLETAVLLGVTALVALGSLPLWSHLRRSPADPGAIFVPIQSLDDNVQHREEAARDLVRRRTSYASDRREDAPAPEVIGRRTAYSSDRRQEEAALELIRKRAAYSSDRRSTQQGGLP